jgi:hypothetical protein
MLRSHFPHAQGVTMHLYMSGTPRDDHYQVIENQICTHRLFSMHGDYQGKVLKWLDMIKSGVRTFDDYCEGKRGFFRWMEHQDKVMRRTLSEQGETEHWVPYADALNMVSAKRGPRYPRHIMLDSGAFTAWNAKKVVSLEEVKQAYAAFLNKAEKLFDEVWLINLDVIPGEVGRSASAEEKRAAAAESDGNLEALRKEFGECILPVFHQDEDKGRLLQVVEQATGYLCLSPRNDLQETKRWMWAMYVRGALQSLNCNVRTHGLATTGNEMIRNAELYSGDSAAWTKHSALGLVDLIRKGTMIERRLPPDCGDDSTEVQDLQIDGIPTDGTSIHEHRVLEYSGYHIARERNDYDRKSKQELIDNPRHYLALSLEEQRWVRERVSETVPFLLAQYDVRARELVNIAELQTFGESFQWTPRGGRTLVNGVDAEVGSRHYHEIRPYPLADDRVR